MSPTLTLTLLLTGEGTELAGVAGVVDAFACRGPAEAVVMEVLG